MSGVPQFELSDNEGTSDIFNESISPMSSIDIPASAGNPISGFMIFNKDPGLEIEFKWEGQTNWLTLSRRERIFLNLQGRPKQIQR